MSVELTTPAVPAVGALNEQLTPAGSVAGHENVRDAGFRAVLPLGVTVTVALPEALGASVKDDGFTEVVNDTARVTTAETALAAL